MKSRVAVLILAVMALIAGFQAPSSAKGEKLDKAAVAAIKKCLQDNLAATAGGDVDAYMKTIHSDSPAYAQTKMTMAQFFASYKVKARFSRLEYLGFDGEYAVVRVDQEMRKVKGPAFQDNLSGAMNILRKDGDTWKVWGTTILTTELLKKKPEPKKAEPKSDEGEEDGGF